MVAFEEEEDKGKPKHTEAEIRKIHERRATRIILPSDPAFAKLHNKKVKIYSTAPKWWSKASIKYAFSHPHVTSRLEKLMGSNLVSLTDRDYMQKLQERILEDYAESMDKRIKIREHEEMERVKNLVLSGRIPLHEAPESMADHPIMLIEKICKRLIAARRAKIKIPKIHIPTHLYYDDTPDPPSGLSIENGHVFRKPWEKLCNPVSRFLPDDDDFVEEEEEHEGEGEGEMNEGVVEVANEEGNNEELGEEEEEEEVVEEFMFSRKEYNRLKYESPLIKKLRKCQTVEELYALADEIIGYLKTLGDGPNRNLEADLSSLARQTPKTASVADDTSSVPSSAHSGGAAN